MSDQFVYFDLGNVLVTFDHRIAAENLAQVSGQSFEAVMNRLFVTDLQRRYETGLITSESYVDEINHALGCQLSTETVLTAISDMFQPNNQILQALELVQARGAAMGILSNTCEAHWQWLIGKQWPMLQDWYDRTMLSYEIQSMKPASRIYEVCEQACGRSGSQIFFTDDRADNIAAANDRGWTTHQYHHQQHDALISALDRWLK